MPRGEHANDRPLVAQCKECPIACSPPRPLLPTIRSDAQCTIVVDYPVAPDYVKGELLKGKLGLRVRAHLEDHGIDRYNIIARIACLPPTKKRVASTLRAAANACNKQLDHDLAWAFVSLPVLALGKHASSFLGSHEFTLRSGATVKIPLAKAAKDIPVGNVMCTDSPAYTLWGKPSLSVPWLTAIGRFADLVHNRRQTTQPPVPIIHPSEDMLGAINRMGGEIGWDVETLGKDPLTSKITCVGIADANKSVSVPWDTYDTAKQGCVQGVVNSRDPLWIKIKEAVLRVLASKRIQCTQNGSYDVLAMSERGLPGRNDYDIMHAYAVLYPECPKTLEAIALHCVPNCNKRWKTLFRAGKDDDAKGADVYAESPAEDLRDYNADDSWYTIAAKPYLDAELAKED